ncbi:CYTH domain-containing protein [Ferrimonas sediminum]|uniref:CYTH domain-containing protein n=1 Tax=Ferrimonas sediminum TaxID=718193 RepID=A0A1G8MDM7_9GAMM|nr:CYTH domain-containing protein [Ferrimonas sediminum]SDI66063.1 CYTH domain-containing protein [Ferrimonas sediminum]
METELKLLLTGVNHHQLVDALSEHGQVLKESRHYLINQYFDTPALALRQMDIGLRVRQKGRAREQTIKTAGTSVAGIHRRPEYNLDLDGDWPDLSTFPALVWQGADVAELQRQLQQQFATNFDRHAIELQLADGTRLEVALDQGEVLADGRSDTIDELELELIEGSLASALALAQTLAKRFALRLGRASKAARGYRLAGLQPPMALETEAPLSLAQGLSAWQANESALLAGHDGARRALITQFNTLTQALMATEPALAMRLGALGQALVDAEDPGQRLRTLLANPGYGQVQLALLARVLEQEQEQG